MENSLFYQPIEIFLYVVSHCMRQFRYFSTINLVVVALAVVIITVRRALVLLEMPNQSKSISYVIRFAAVRTYVFGCIVFIYEKKGESRSNARVH